MIKYIAAQCSAQKYVQVPWSVRLSFDVHISLEYTRGGQIDTHRGEKYKAVGGDIHREWDYTQIWRSLSFRVLWSNRLRLTNSLVQVQYNTDTQWKDIDKWNGFIKEKWIPTEEVQTAVGWLRYMLPEWRYTLHRGGTTTRNCRRRGVTLGYTQLLENGLEFGDEAE